MTPQIGPGSDQPPLTWFKASVSSENGACVEVARKPDGTVATRDSKDPDGPQLAFAPEAWGVFVDSVRSGEFNRG